MSYLKEHEKLVTLSQDLHEKQHIEQGVNRYLIVVSDLNSLVATIEQETGRNDRVLVLVTSTMCKVFQQHLEEVVNGLAALTDLGTVQVVEIGIGKVFKGALSFADATSFIEFCRNTERTEYIEFLERSNEKDKQAESRVLRELLIERDASLERVEGLQEQLAETEKRLEDALSSAQALETQIEHVYKIEIHNAQIAIQQQIEERQEQERLYKLERAKVRDYEAESSRYRTENKSLQLDKESFQQMLEERKQEIRGYISQINILKMDIDKAERERADFLKSKVDAEVLVRLTQELDTERAQVRKTMDDLQRVETESRKKDFLLMEREQEIDELRKDKAETGTTGRSLLLDVAHFKSTNIYYVKVITPLPYLTSALRGLYKLIKEREGGRTHVCLLANDEGLNDRMFKGFELYGTLGDVQERHERFILHPTRRMFTGVEKFDKEVKAVLIVDFIKSKDYYAKTDGFSRVITVCRDSSMIHNLELQGTPVSLDANSLLDINFDSRVHTATTKEMQNRYIQMKVEAWAERLNLK